MQEDDTDLPDTRYTMTIDADLQKTRCKKTKQTFKRKKKKMVQTGEKQDARR